MIENIFNFHTHKTKKEQCENQHMILQKQSCDSCFMSYKIDLSIRVLFGIEDLVALDRQTRQRYNTLLSCLIMGCLYSACVHRHIHTFYTVRLHAKQGGSLNHSHNGLQNDSAGAQTPHPLYERRIC